MVRAEECWKEFYREMDPERRRQLYSEVIQEHADDGANALRRELLDLRYIDPKNSSHRVDNFIWQIVLLPGLLRPIYFIKAAGEREIRGIIKALGLENAGKWDEAERGAAYWEYRNAAALYLTTCTGPGYAKKVFGIMQSTDEEKLNKTAGDFYSMTVTVPERYGVEKEMELFTSALRDTFRSSSGAAEQAWQVTEYMKKHK